jgi:cell division protein FtsB
MTPGEVALAQAEGFHRLVVENAALRAEVERLRGALGGAAAWIGEFARADLDELAADGGVTVGMVFQQQAKWRAEQARQALRGTDA